MGLTKEPCLLTSTYKTGVIICETVLSESGNFFPRPEFGNSLHSVAIVKVVQCLFCWLHVMRPFYEGYWTRGHVENKHVTSMRYSDQQFDCQIMQGNIGNVRDFYVQNVNRHSSKNIFSYII